MPTFTKKSIAGIQTLGEKLAAHRQAKGFSVEQVAHGLNVNQRYLKFIEQDEYDKMPAPVYTANLLKTYARFLGLNENMVLTIHHKEKSLYYKTGHEPRPAHRIFERYSSFFDILLKPRTIKLAIFLALFGAVIAYLGLSVNRIFSPPELIIKNPHQTSIITTQQTITLEGITEKEVNLTVNDKLILCDNQGRFNINLDLQKGLNVIKIAAKKKHSQANTIYRQVIVDDQPDNVLTQDNNFNAANF